jgi:hypothetical protein
VSRAINDLNSLPKFLRPLLYRFLPRIKELRRQVSEAHRVMGKVLKEREALLAAGEAPEYVDAIEWFKQVRQSAFSIHASLAPLHQLHWSSLIIFSFIKSM